MKLYTLTYSHKHGEDVSVFATEAAAVAAVVEIVDTYWNDSGLPADIPAEERVDAYFDASEQEFYGINSAEVEGLDEDSALTLFHQLRDQFNWAGTVFITGDITGALDPDFGMHLVDPKTGDELTDEQLTEITPAVVAHVKDSYYWRKMQDQLAEHGNELVQEAVNEAVDELLAASS